MAARAKPRIASGLASARHPRPRTRGQRAVDGVDGDAVSRRGSKRESKRNVEGSQPTTPPTHLPASNRSSNRASNPNTTNPELETLHAALTTTTAPAISPAELGRVLEGAPAFGVVLRTYLARVGGPARALEAGADDATEALRRAEAEVETAHAEAKTAHAQLIALEAKTDALERALRRTRLANALLGALGAGARVRVGRVGELGEGLGVVRKDAQGGADSSSSRDGRAESRTADDLRRGHQREKPIRADAVLDTLATLQGYHARLARLSRGVDLPGTGPSSSSGAGSGSGALEARLLARVAASMGKREDDPEARRVYEACLAHARRGARRRVGYTPPVPERASDARVDGGTLSALERRVLVKEARVRETGARVGALRASCMGSLRALRAFRDATVPILQDSLDEDARAVKDHVRILHASVEEVCRDRAHDRAQAASVGQPWAKTPASLRADVVAEYERWTFLAAVALRPPGDAGDAERLGTVRGEQGRVEAGLRRVLGRKLDKSRVGDGLVVDVRVLVDEIKTVAGVF